MKATKGSSVDHSSTFNCNCFRCYMSYWVRWDSSPNNQLIHEIIDAFEDGLLSSKNIDNNKRNNSSNRGKRERKKKGLNCSDSAAVGDDSTMGFAQIEMGSTSRAAEVSGGDGTESPDEGVAIHKKSWTSNFTTLAKVQLCRVHRKFLKKDGDGHLKFAWFGTSKEGVDRIMSYGFGVSELEQTNGMYGHGTYLAPDDSPLERQSRVISVARFHCY